MSRQAVWALVILIVAGAGAGYLWQLPPAGKEERARPPARVNVLEPATARIRDQVEAVGTLRAQRAADVVSEVDGRIQSLPVAEGQRVTAGEVLVTLDDRQARADLAVAQAQLEDARAKLQRAQRLRSSNSISQADLDELQTALSVAEARISLYRTQLDNTRIVAPFAGKVGLRTLTVGTYVKAGDRITTLDSDGRMELVFAVPERWLGALRAGLAVEARSDAFPEKVFSGRVDRLDSRVDPVSRSLQVRALVDNPKGELRPGQFMHVRLVLREREGLTLPEQAILTQGNDRFVFVVDADGKARRTLLDLGQREAGRVEVVSGLASDARVVVNGQARLRDGDAVQILEDAEALLSQRQGEG